MGTYIIDKRNLDDSDIYDESQGSRAGSTNLKSIPLAKIEMVVSDVDAKLVVEMISKNSDLSSIHGGKILFLKWKKSWTWTHLMDNKTLKHIQKKNLNQNH